MNMAALQKAIIAAGLSVIAASALAAEGQVATLARITGDAVVSKGAQYVSGTEGMVLKIGERVMSLAASRAVIQFNDGCRYVLEANQLLTIENKSPCVLGLLPQQGSTPVAASGAAASVGWVPLAAVGIVAIPGAALDTGMDNPRPAISP